MRGRKLRRGILRRNIVIVGPDGSGKSTLLTDLFRRFRNTNQKYSHIHFITLQDEHEQPNAIMPQNLPTRSLFVSSLSVLYRFIRFQFTLQSARRNSVHIIQERGWWDQIVDPKRYRLHLKSIKLVRLLGKILPHPEIIFILGGDLEIIAKRKNELSVEETSRQYEQWLKMKGIAPLVCINSTNNSNTSNIVVNFLSKNQNLTNFKVYKPLFFPRQYDCFATKGDFLNLLSFFQHKTLSKRIIVFILLFLANIGLKSEVNRNNLINPLFLFSNLEKRNWSIAAQKSSYRYRWNVKLNSNDMNFMIKMEFDNSDSLMREFTFLHKIFGNSKMFLVPKPISLIQKEGWTILISELLQPLKFKSKPSSCHVTKILEELRCFTSDGITHGDFSKWNIFRCQQGIAIIDWESAKEVWIEKVDERRYAETEFI